jgi:hypothetical protein
MRNSDGIGSFSSLMETSLKCEFRWHLKKKKKILILEGVSHIGFIYLFKQR